MGTFHLSITVLATACLAACAAPEPRASSVAHARAAMPSVSMSGIAPAPGAPGPLAEQVLPSPDVFERLERLAPDLDRGVLALAVEARSCAVRHGEVDDDARLAVIDYSKPSTQPRLWVFDVAADQLLFHEYVAHGQGSGENIATRFSNRDGSHETSLGLYRTAETYMGGNGYSMRMDGLDAGFNDHARARAIVMHGADYVDPVQASARGRLGRSFGCPAVRREIAKVVIDSLKQRQLLFAFGNDAAWLRNGQSFACDGRSAQQILAAGRGMRAGGTPAGSLGAS